jgi:hypothetical protein
MCSHNRMFHDGVPAPYNFCTPPPDECSGNSAAAMGIEPDETQQSSSAPTGYEGSSSTSRDTVALSSGSYCTLPPKVTVQSVGFKGDWEVRQFINGDVNDPVIAPGNEPTWVKGRSGNDKYVVAYTRGQSPTIFATFSVSQADGNTSATVRVRRGDTLLASFPLDVSANGTVSVDNIGLPAQIGEPALAREKDYNFKWEVSLNGGSWKSAGESGDHKIYWLMNDPRVSRPDEPNGDPYHFRNVVGKGYLGLYDLALEKSIGKLDGGTANVTEAIRKITNGVANELIYNPGRRSDTEDGGLHPLEVYRPALTVPPENVPEDPHFSYHATVTAEGQSYDPSYGSKAGDISQPVTLLQAVNDSGTCVNGSAADNNWKVKTNHRPSGVNGTPFGSACGNRPPSTGFPRSASVVSQSVPTYMEAGASYLASITLRNTGDNTWTDADLYRLGSQNPHDNWHWGTNRVAVPRSVEPGEEVTFDFYVTAPYSPGYYNFQWRMVQDGVEWFGDSTPNVQVQVYSLYTCDPWQEQDCWNRGGWWDSSSCYCNGGWWWY